MIESLDFYTALYILAAPWIMMFALIVLALVSVPVYLIATRNDKELEK